MNAPDSSQGRRYSQTLSRGIDVLKLLSHKAATTRDVALELGFNRTTTYRLIQTLVAHGLVQQDSDEEGLFRLTPRVWELGVGTLAPSEIRRAASLEVRALADMYGESVHLGVYHAGEVVYIDKADGWQPIGSYTRLGGRAPGYCVATGKALLAYQGTDAIQKVIDRGLESHTENTISAPGKLWEVLATIRERGYALNYGEWRVDVAGIAVPLFDSSIIPVAALGFSGPTDRVLSRTDELLAVLQEAAKRIGRN